MAIPTSALSRRDRLWPAVSFSVAGHVLLIAWALLRVPPPQIDLEQKPIVAKLVRLGEKKPEEYLPRKETPPPAPAPATPAPVAVPAPTPAPVAVAAPTAPILKTDPKPAPPKQTSPTPGKQGGTTLASVLSKVRDEVRHEQRWGSPDGDAAGDSETAAEGDRYLAVVYREIHANYDVPTTISERERLYLKATVVIFIEPTGQIARWTFQSRSGNAAYDAALERTLRETRVPPPPEALRDTYRRGGVQLEFKI
jgi:colicin import membrane protein/protein TonB